MSDPKTQYSEKVERICSRLQLLLGQWVESIPIISNASSLTFISQLDLFVEIIKNESDKKQWAQHDLPILLMQTLSQMWDREENEKVLVKNGVIDSLELVYKEMSSALLPITTSTADENRFPEFLSLFTVICEEPNQLSSKEDWIKTYSKLQEAFIPLLLHDIIQYPNALVENKRQLCFTLISLLSANSKTIINILCDRQEEVAKLSSSIFLHQGSNIFMYPFDFPMQCTLLEIVYRLFLLTRSLSNSSLTNILLQNCPINLEALTQNQFIEDGRRTINSYNQEHSTGVFSIPLAQLFIITPTSEIPFESVSWLDFGSDTISSYIEIEDSSHIKELQLLSIRWSSIQSFDFIERTFSLRLSFILSHTIESDFLLPYLSDRSTLMCIRLNFSQDVFPILHKKMEFFISKLTCTIQTINSNQSRIPIPIPTHPNDISLSQNAKGIKSSVVAIDQFVNNTKEKASTAIPFVPETQDSHSNSTPLATPAELLFPENHQTTPPQKPLDVLSSLHSTPSKPSTSKPKPNTTKENPTIPNKLAGLSRRKGMSFLSQLTENKTEKPMESGYSRTWKLPRRSTIENAKVNERPGTSEKQSEAPKKSAHKPSQKKKATTQTAGRKKAQPNVIKKKSQSDSSDSDVDDETNALVDHVKSLLSTPKYKLTESINSSPVSTNSESDDDSPNMLAFQQAITTLLLQQKKEKEKQIQQSRKQLDSTIKVNTAKIINSSQKEFESFIKQREQEIEHINTSIKKEFDTLESKKTRLEQDIALHFSKIQQFQQCCAELSNCETAIQSATMKYSAEIRKMCEQLVADYQRRVKSIKKKSSQKKYSEIQKLMQLTFSTLTDCE